MNRFFSKLDLRDIKIDPEGSRFPPDADERVHPEPETAPEAQVVASSPNVEETPPELLQDVAPLDATTWESPIYRGSEPSVKDGTQPITHSDVATGAELPETPIEQSAYGVEGVIVGSDGDVLKVSARSRPSAVAGAIAGVVREVGRAEVQAIGAGATNQAVKAVAIARDYLHETGIDAVCVPAFIDVTIENEDRTAIRLVVEPR